TDIGEDAKNMIGLRDRATRDIHQVETIIVSAQVLQCIGVGVDLDTRNVWLSHWAPLVLFHSLRSQRMDFLAASLASRSLHDRRQARCVELDPKPWRLRYSGTPLGVEHKRRCQIARAPRSVADPSLSALIRAVALWQLRYRRGFQGMARSIPHHDDQRSSPSLSIFSSSS